MNYGEDELGSFGDENEIKVIRWVFICQGFASFNLNNR